MVVEVEVVVVQTMWTVRVSGLRLEGAAASSPAVYTPSMYENPLPSLRPNLAIILVGLGFTFMLVCAFALFAKCMNPHFQRRRDMRWELERAGAGAGQVEKEGQGVDPNLISSLPLIYCKKRSSLLPSASGRKGEADWDSSSRYKELEMECVVCLTAFEDGEQLRQLPLCHHAFHPECVDSWLRAHPSCPLCRRTILSGKCKVPDSDAGPSSAVPAHHPHAPAREEEEEEEHGVAHLPEIIVVGEGSAAAHQLSPPPPLQQGKVAPSSATTIASSSTHL